jgi:hypothetical protein
MLLFFVFFSSLLLFCGTVSALTAKEKDSVFWFWVLLLLCLLLLCFFFFFWPFWRGVSKFYYTSVMAEEGKEEVDGFECSSNCKLQLAILV